MKQVTAKVTKEKFESVLKSLEYVSSIRELDVNFNIDDIDYPRIQEIMTSNYVKWSSTTLSEEKSVETQLKDIMKTYPEKLSNYNVLELLKTIFLSRGNLSGYKKFKDKEVDKDESTMGQSMAAFIRGYYFDIIEIKRDLVYLLKTKWMKLKEAKSFPEFFDVLFDLTLFSNNKS